MDAATHTHMENLVFCAGMTAFAEDLDGVVSRRVMPARIEPTLLSDCDFLPQSFGE